MKIREILKIIKNGVLIFITFICTQVFSQIPSNVIINELQVEYQEMPLGIDSKNPRFSWQMKVASKKRGIHQTAYQIIVKNERNHTVWDSKKVLGNKSLGIVYSGERLQASTTYTWKVLVWNQDNASSFSSSWFETGLMNPDPKLGAWEGAKWIGGGNNDLILYSQYLSVYRLKYNLQLDKPSKTTKAGFVFGANDKRLMKKDLNIQGVENKANGSYISFELDISEVDGTESGLANFNMYRVGYHLDDKATVPFKSFTIPKAIINNQNKYTQHQFYVECNFGLFEIYLNGKEKENKITDLNNSAGEPSGTTEINLNPVGKGSNYISYPMVADIGFKLGRGQKAIFSEIEIRNFRSPSNTLFFEKIGQAITYDGIFSSFVNNKSSGLTIAPNSYLLDGGSNGVLITADPSQNSMPMLRTEFKVQNKPISKARLYVTARGIYEMYLNGQKVGEDYFNPGLTQYNKTHMYQTYDVTHMIQKNDENALGAWLGEGWWSGNISYVGENWNYFGDRQSLLSKLVITYEDGSKQHVTSNPNQWNYFNDGPILYGSFFQGEVYDARKEEAIKGWNTSSYDDSRWKPAVEVPLEGTSFMANDFNYNDLQIIAQIGKNPKVVKTLTANSVEEVRPGVFIYDMGQNMVGFPEIKIYGGQRSDTIIARYAEVKYPNLKEYEGNVGMIMLENIRAALTQDIMILKGGDEVFQPRFTFHGYRYLEVTGFDKAIPIENVKGKVISSIDKITSHYETSNKMVNKLWENITWSMRGNFLSIPTDTPARNERMGWSGDINVFSRASTYLGDVQPFLRRHMQAMRDIQNKQGRFTDVAPIGGGFGGTLWGSAGIVVAWEVYQQYGDTELLREHYGAMKSYVEFLGTKVNPKTGILDEGPLGDWLSPEGFKNDNSLLWNAYQVYDLEILAKVAEILDYEEDASIFWNQHKDRKAFFNKTYVDIQSHKTIHTGKEGFSFGPTIPEDRKPKAGDFVDTQASYAIPLAFNVFNDKHKAFAIAHLANTIKRKNIDEAGIVRPEYSLMTGFIGTASLGKALSENGHSDLAYRLLQQISYPSWLYSVVNGATTIWERLNSYTVEDGFGGNNSMNSFNHYSFGAVAAWMYNYSLGIQRKDPGFKEFILKPTPDPDKVMTWAKGYYDSMYGRITSEWKIVDQENIIYTFTIPANTNALLYLPATSISKVEENGEKIENTNGVRFLSSKDDRLIFRLESGSYTFKVKN
jgi:alpha-L-rhamnosidase